MSGNSAGHVMLNVRFDIEDAEATILAGRAANRRMYGHAYPRDRAEAAAVDDLRDNAIHYFESMVERAERRNARDFPGEQSYRLDTDDATVFLADDYCQEVAEAEAAGLGAIAVLPAAERRDIWRFFVATA